MGIWQTSTGDGQQYSFRLGPIWPCWLREPCRFSVQTMRCLPCWYLYRDLSSVSESEECGEVGSSCLFFFFKYAATINLALFFSSVSRHFRWSRHDSVPAHVRVHGPPLCIQDDCHSFFYLGYNGCPRGAAGADDRLNRRSRIPWKGWRSRLRGISIGLVFVDDIRT